MDPTIEHLPAQLVLGMRTRAPYSNIPRMLGETFAYMQQHGTHPTGAPMAIYRELSQANDATKDHDLEVVWPVPAKIPDHESMKCYELSGGEMATTVYKGPYDKIAPAYAELMQWIALQGKRPIGPVRESYLNDPQEVGMENALTKIIVPV